MVETFEDISETKTEGWRRWFREQDFAPRCWNEIHVGGENRHFDTFSYLAIVDDDVITIHCSLHQHKRIFVKRI